MAMNIKKIICELWGKGWDWCGYYWDNVDLCADTKLLSSPYCPVVRVRMKKSDKPQSECTVHHAPDPPKPKWKVCTATGLEATKWCPSIDVVYAEPRLACRRHRPPQPSKKDADFIIFSFDPFRHDVPDDELEGAIVRAGESGCDYDRMFLSWPGDGRVRMQPFLSAGPGAVLPWDVYKFNPEWAIRLRKFQRMLARAGMGIMMDFFGLQVAQMTDKVPYAWFVQPNNRNDIDGYRDLRPHVMDYWRWCLREVMDMIGVEGNLVHLGNEQRAPGDGGYGNTVVVRVRDWCRKWSNPLGFYVRDALKARMPLSFRGEEYEGTGKGQVNELYDAGGWPWTQLCNHLHGLSLWENFEKDYMPTPERPDVGWAQPKRYCLSDDGGGYDIPVEKRGVQCPMFPHRWSVNQEWRIDTVRRIKERIRNVRFIEWMPMEYKSDTCRPGDLDQAVSVDVYWRCAEELWGVDIRRDL